MSTKKNSRSAILEAAEEVVAKVGATHLTLEAVAEKAGVSKGGLLYHFPNKDALVQGMLDRFLAQMEKRSEEEMAKLPPGPNRELKAFIRSRIDLDPGMQKISTALLAAAAHDPQFIAPAQQMYQEKITRFMASGIRPERVAVVSLATDGLLILEQLGASPLDQKMRQAMIEELFRLVDE